MVQLFSLSKPRTTELKAVAVRARFHSEMTDWGV